MPRHGRDDQDTGPLAYCRERDIARWAGLRAYPIIPCDLCGSQDHLQRNQVKAMLRLWEREQPGRVANIARSLRAVVPSHLCDTNLFDFLAQAVHITFCKNRPI